MTNIQWFAIAFMLVYIVAVVIAMYWKQQHRGIECAACRDRRRLIRVGLLLIVGFAILGEQAIHWPDVGFFALAIALELS